MCKIHVSFLVKLICETSHKKSTFCTVVTKTRVLSTGGIQMSERRQKVTAAIRWQAYERIKAALQALHLPLAEYEARLQNAAKELKA